MSLLALAANLFPPPLSLVPMLFLSLATQRYTPKLTTRLQKEYDYIVVGAGSAGSTVAGRLSELPCARVLLLEAGSPPPLYSEVPAFFGTAYFTDMTWKLFTEPQRHGGTAHTTKRYPYFVGKALGGSSSVNGMIVGRGNPKNYDDWAESGAVGWDSRNVTKYFQKLENDTREGRHSNGGPMTFSEPRYRSEMNKALLETAKQLGYNFIDYDGPSQIGFNDLVLTTRNGRRCSTAKAYLVPNENRTNLHIVAKAMVTKVSICLTFHYIKEASIPSYILKVKITVVGGVATGVEFTISGVRHSARARREVIVSAGAVHTPKLLMLSGIGPRMELKRHGIPVVADLPVGENLQDHPGGLLAYRLRSSVPSIVKKIADPGNIEEYITRREGFYTSPSMSMMAFDSNNDTGRANNVPDFQVYFIESQSEFALGMGITLEAFTRVFLKHAFRPIGLCMSQAVRPKSRGSVRLRSRDPNHPPRVDPNYLAHPQDVRDIVQGLKYCNRIFSHPSMAEVVEEPFDMTYPGCEGKEKNSDDFYECVARALSLVATHPTGTAKMGAADDKTTVVDPELRVKGISRLRVADASVMPNIIWGNTNVPTIMIGEKAADMIKRDHQC